MIKFRGMDSGIESYISESRHPTAILLPGPSVKMSTSCTNDEGEIVAKQLVDALPRFFHIAEGSLYVPSADILSFIRLAFSNSRCGFLHFNLLRCDRVFYLFASKVFVDTSPLLPFMSLQFELQKDTPHHFPV